MKLHDDITARRGEVASASHWMEYDADRSNLGCSMSLHVLIFYVRAQRQGNPLYVVVAGSEVPTAAVTCMHDTFFNAYTQSL